MRGRYIKNIREYERNKWPLLSKRSNLINLDLNGTGSEKKKEKRRNIAR